MPAPGVGDPDAGTAGRDSGPALTRRWLAIVVLLAVAGAWGASFTLVKHILTKIAPEPFIFWRFTLAVLILVAVAAWQRSLSRATVLPGVALGALVFGGFWLQTREPLTTYFVAGAALILAAMIVSQLKRLGSVTMRADGPHPGH